MRNYQKTYKEFQKGRKRRKSFKLIKIITIFILDLIFKTLIISKKILSITLLKVIPILGVVLYKIASKIIIIPIYSALLSFKRRSRTIFSSSSNKLLFLFSNRYVAHTVAILIIFITIFQNVSIKNVRAEDFGKKAIFARLYQGQNLEEEIIEEEIIIPVSDKTNTFSDLSPGVSQKIKIKEEPNHSSGQVVLAQGGSAIIKPNVVETNDTPQRRNGIITYTVKQGDNVFNISEEFGISVNTILWANKLSSRSIIRPGDKLKILPVSGVEHIVKRGETVSSIAAKYSVPKEDIIEVNNLSPAGTIRVGQSIIIPGGRPIYSPAPPRRSYVVRSTKKYVSKSGSLFWPTTCRRITQYFKGWRHTGIDIACSMGKNIYAAEEGIVERAGWNSGGYGNRIIIKHPDGSKTLYAHLKIRGIIVSPGQYVQKGQLIGYMGSTGRSTGPHLHFEVIVNGRRINPFNRL